MKVQGDAHNADDISDAIH